VYAYRKQTQKAKRTLPNAYVNIDIIPAGLFMSDGEGTAAVAIYNIMLVIILPAINLLFNGAKSCESDAKQIP
jgi:hypothetical protein